MNPNTITPQALLSHADFVRGLARSLVGDTSAAEDVVQETLLSGLRKRDFDQAKTKSWLGTVARNVVRQRMRRDQRRVARERAAARQEVVPSSADVLERESSRSRVVEMVLALPEPARVVVLLRYFENRAPREIAKVLAIPVETVRTRLKRALESMRGELDAEGGREAWLSALAPIGAVDQVGIATFVLSTATRVVLGLSCLLVAAAGIRMALQSPSPVTQTMGIVANLENASPMLGTRDLVPAPAVKRADVFAQAGGAKQLHGSVRDNGGKSLANAIVFVSPVGPPPAEFYYNLRDFSPLELPAQNTLKLEEQWIRCNEQGEFSIPVVSQRRFVSVAWAASSHGFEHVEHVLDLWPHEGVWVQAGAETVQLTVPFMAKTTLIVRGRIDGEEGWVKGLRVAIRSKKRGGFLSTHGEGETLEVELNVPRNGAWRDSLLEAKHGANWLASTSVTLVPDARQDIELVFPAADWVRGHVLDSNGNGVQDALVFFGLQMRMRGDEPFKPYQPKRITEAVRTDAAGFFELQGPGRKLSVWSAEHSPVTVARASAERIVLPARGEIRGRLLDSEGAPIPGAEVTLDRERAQTTDTAGRFFFDKVQAGVRGLGFNDTPRSRLGRRLLAVTVLPGETVEVDFGTGVPRVDLKVFAGSERWPNKFKGAVVASADLGGLGSIQGKEGVAQLENLVRGPYTVVLRGGMVASLEINGPNAEIDFGEAALTIHAAPGTRVFVAPAGANELVELMCARVGSVRVPDSGQLMVSPLPPGRYGVGVDRQGVQTVVEVTGPDAEVKLE